MIAILVASIAAISQARPPAPKNLVVNGGAEKGSSEAPEGWSRAVFPPAMSVDGEVEYIWHASQAHTGKRSLCFKKAGTRYFPVAQWTQRIPWSGNGGNLAVSTWIKAREVGKATLTVQCNSADGEQLARSFVAYVGAKNAGDPPATQDWTQYKTTVEVPAGTTQVTIAPEMYGPGVVWFDDITVTRTAAP